jgi:hypothetical protein
MKALPLLSTSVANCECSTTPDADDDDSMIIRYNVIAKPPFEGCGQSTDTE